MAGHSKWANIKHRKGAQDAKRAKIFNKLSKEIMVASALGGSDPNMNASLRLAISKAKAKSMPKKNIETAIKKGAGETSAKSFKEVQYGANVSGISFIVECLTDNVNRLTANIQHYFHKANGELTSISGVAYIFERKGILEIDEKDVNITEEELMMLSLDAGADDFELDSGIYYIYSNPQNFSKVKNILKENKINVFKANEVLYVPNNNVLLSKSKAEKIVKLIDKIEDDDDVQAVYHNLDSESLL